MSNSSYEPTKRVSVSVSGQGSERTRPRLCMSVYMCYSPHQRGATHGMQAAGDEAGSELFVGSEFVDGERKAESEED